jgi:hypothetical protein
LDKLALSHSKSSSARRAGGAPGFRFQSGYELLALPLGFERALQQLTDRSAPRRDFALSPAPVFKRFKDGPKAQLDRCVIRGLLEITHVSLAAIAVQRGNNPKLENP